MSDERLIVYVHREDAKALSLAMWELSALRALLDDASHNNEDFLSCWRLLAPIEQRLADLFYGGALDTCITFRDDELDVPIKPSRGRQSNKDLAATCRRMAEMFESGESEETGGDA